MADDDILVRLAALESQVVSVRAEIARKDGFVVYQQERIDKVERALEESARLS